MPIFTAATVLSCSPEQAWEFLIRPTNLLRVSPPDLNVTLVDAPEVLQLGSRFTVEVSRWGVSQRIVSEVTAFATGASFTDEQKLGPFKAWSHTHRIEVVPEGTRMSDEITFEPPGGLLGFVMTRRRIEEEMGRTFAYRAEQLKELLG